MVTRARAHFGAPPPPAYDDTPARDSGAPAPSSVIAPRGPLALEVAAGPAAGSRFGGDATGRTAERTLDASLTAGVVIGSGPVAFAAAVEHLGLGKDRFAPTPSGETLDARYTVDTLWLGARVYLSEQRPALYLSVAGGPTLPSVRATGVHAGGSFGAPPTAFACSGLGHVGGAAAFAVGTEFALPQGFALLVEGRAAAHFLDGDETFGGCVPARPNAASGALRLGLGYRF